MANSSLNLADDKVKYSKFLSSLFCSTSIIGLSILCLLNNLTFDIYSAGMLLKTVIPASFCFWFLGYAMGHILDDYHGQTQTVKKIEMTNDDAAYEIPSMFTMDTPIADDEFGDL